MKGVYKENPKSMHIEEESNQRHLKEERSIATQDNAHSQNSQTSGDESEIESEDIKRRNNRYSFSSEAGRKNVLILCLLVVCLVGNFNEHRSSLGRKNLLFTDLDQILNENKLQLEEALESARGHMQLGINELNPEYVELRPPGQEARPSSIVKMNGLVPFVAKRLPLEKSQEQTLYDLCMRYANVRIERDCQCPKDGVKSTGSHEESAFKPKFERSSKYHHRNLQNDQYKKPTMNNVVLSKYVSNTKALEPYKGNGLNQLDLDEDIRVIEKVEEPPKKKEFQNVTPFGLFQGNSQRQSPLDNFAAEKISSSFKLPQDPGKSISPFLEFMPQKKVKESGRKMVYKCHLKETSKEDEEQASQFDLVLGKRCFDKIKTKGTYFSTNFTTF
jgi:hypothetical protein